VEELGMASVCELKVVLRGAESPVPMEGPAGMEVTVSFIADVMEDSIEDMLEEPDPPITAKGPE
jgi:hypothetical protein